VSAIESAIGWRLSRTEAVFFYLITVIYAFLCFNVLQVSEAKEVTAFAGKYKEAKRCRAYEAYQHLAAAVTFDTQIQPLLQLVQDKLPSATSPSIRAKLEQLLTAAARGVAVNPSVTAEGLAVWLGKELDACLKVEEAARAKAKAAVGAATATGSAAGKRTPQQQSDAAAAAAAEGDEEEDAESAAAAAAAGDGSQHLYLLVHFCLTVLNGGLKKGVLSGRSAEVLALLDPLLPLLVRCLYSRHLGSVQVGWIHVGHIVLLLVEPRSRIPVFALHVQPVLVCATV
jgi:U3 small nucleolar RNA-associated protein 20